MSDYFLKNKNWISFLTALVVIIVVIVLVPAIVQGADKDIFGRSTDGLQNAVDQAYGGDKTVELTATGPGAFAGRLISVINYLLSFIGIIFFCLLIYAGYLWMMARGNEEEIKKAQKIIREAVVGIIVILVARIITEFLLTQFGTVTTVPPTPK